MPYAKSLLASAALLLVSSSAHAAVVINEFFANPDDDVPEVGGSEVGKEWVELYNNGADPVDISGWTLEAGGNPRAASITVRATVPADTTLAAGAYYVISRGPLGGVDAGAPGDGITTMTGLLGNASSNSDMVRIKDAAFTVVDTVVYGRPNTEAGDDAIVGFGDDLAQPAVSLAPKPDEGRTLGRALNGVDTNLSAVDFISTPTGQNTPGAANYEAPPVPDAGPSSSSSSSGSSSSSSSSGGRSSSSSSGGRSSSSSSGSRADAGASGGRNPEGDDDDDDNANLAADDGGCSMGATGAPMPFLVGLGALLVIRRRRLARK